jgi:ubiquinone/menaquinone biosynthesis C-methylase UbiE
MPESRIGFRDHYEEVYSRISESDMYTAKNPMLRLQVNERHLLIKEFLTELCDSKWGLRLLDVGSAEAFLSGYVRKFGCVYVAVDIARVNLKKAKKNGVLHLVQADAEYLPFRDLAFDLAVCTEVLEHLNHPSKALHEIARTASMALISTPVVGCPLIIDDLIANGRSINSTVEIRRIIDKFGYKKALDLLNKMTGATHINIFTWSILSKMILTQRARCKLANVLPFALLFVKKC